MTLLLLLACDDTLFGAAQDTASEAIAEPADADVEAIFLDRCAGCHVDGAAQGGLALDHASALVGLPSTEAPDLFLVDPGSPSTSYLWAKLTGEQVTVGGSGGAMPPGAALGAGDLGTIENWITLLDG